VKFKIGRDPGGTKSGDPPLCSSMAAIEHVRTSINSHAMSQMCARSALRAEGQRIGEGLLGACFAIDF
jgi:hypothetical protein